MRLFKPHTKSSVRISPVAGRLLLKPAGLTPRPPQAVPGPAPARERTFALPDGRAAFRLYVPGREQGWGRPAVAVGLGLLLALGTAIPLLGWSSFWLVTTCIWIMLPGNLTLRAMRGTTKNHLFNLSVSFGLGLAVLLVLGLLASSLHWLAGVERPLSTGWMLGLLNGYCLIMAGVSFLFRRRYLPELDSGASEAGTGTPLRNRFPRGHWLSIVVTSLVGTGLVLLTYFGVNRLDNGFGPGLLLTATALTCLTPLAGVFARKRLGLSGLLILLSAASLSLLLASSLRSHSLFGSDIINEYRMFELTNAAGFWSASHIANTYNLCLSITVLPQVLHILTGQDGLFVFKIIMQVIFSICPVIIFLIARRYVDPIKSFLAAMMFIVFGNYIGSMPNHIRQEIAFLFFALMVLVLVNKDTSRLTQKALFVLFGLAMIVSHYSTSYVALLVFAAFTACFYVLKFVQARYGRRLAIARVSPGVLAALLLFTVFWYSQLAATSGGPLAYARTMTVSITHGHQKLQASDTGLGDQFKHSSQGLNTVQAFAEFQKSGKVGYAPQYIAPEVSRSIVPLLDHPAFGWGVELVKKAYKLLLLVSVVLVLGSGLLRHKSINNEYTVLAAACAGIIAVSFVIPSFTVDYDQERFFQQLLVVLSVAATATWFMAFQFDPRKPVSRLRLTVAAYSFALFLGLYMAVSSGLSSQVIGGSPLSAKFNNYGMDFGRYYVHTGDLLAAQWARDNRQYRGVYTDPYGANRVRLVDTRFNPQENFFPAKTPRDSYVYFYAATIQQHQTYASYRGQVLSMTPPEEYYADKADTLYVNGSGAVYVVR